MKFNIKYFLSLFLLMGLIIGCGEKQTEEDLLKQANTFEKEEKYDEALHAYEKLLKKYPKSEHAGEALQKVAFLYYNNINDFHKAIECHQRLIKAYPESNFIPQARFMIGYIYANDLKDYDKAKIAYNEFLEHHPNNELVESVKWELEHLGKDVNEQLINLFGNEQSKSNGEVKVN